ncbi:MAG: RsiV family protein [Alistipes sp.]|jgi:hypothetical protein|nr:RsiV family protein [Alistipes sp.]
MKIEILALVALLLTLASCRRSPVRAIETTTVENFANFSTPGGDFEYEYSFEHLSDFSDSEVLGRIRASMIAEFFGPEFVWGDEGGDVVAGAAAFDEAMRQNYSTRTDPRYRSNGWLKVASSVGTVGRHTLTFTVRRSEYMGGAHGMETLHHANYDLTTGERIILDELFAPEEREKLIAAIRANILSDKGVDTWERLVADSCYVVADEVAPTENFLLSRGRVTFVYNPYDIACFAAGATSVTLPTGKVEL